MTLRVDYRYITRTPTFLFLIFYNYFFRVDHLEVQALISVLTFPLQAQMLEKRKRKENYLASLKKEPQEVQGI